MKGTQNGNWPNAANTTPASGSLGIDPWQAPPVRMITDSFRGGINKIQFYHQPYDSLLGSTFTPTNFIWTDTFVYWDSDPNVVGISDAQGRRIGTMTANQPGITWHHPNPNLAGANFWRQNPIDGKFDTQILGRTVSVPDIVFAAGNLGNSADGVPIGFTRVAPIVSSLNPGANFGPNPNNEAGPGTYTLNGNGTATSFTFTVQSLWIASATTSQPGPVLVREMLTLSSRSSTLWMTAVAPSGSVKWLDWSERTTTSEGSGACKVAIRST